MIQAVADFVQTILFSIVAVVGVNLGTEEPAYDVRERLSDRVEIRSYGPRIVAETTVDPLANQAFRIVAGYIFGNNKGSSSIAMTAPVEVDPSGDRIAMTAPVEIADGEDRLTMRFFMPSRYTLADLPEPNDPRVRLRVVPASIVAIIRFSGLSDHRNQPQVDELRQALQNSSWKEAGPPTGFYYNPPWTLPFLRRNEVAIPVIPTDLKN